LKLAQDEATGRIAVAYHHHRFPIRPEDQQSVAANLSRYDDPAALHDLLEQQNFRLAWWRTAGDQINWRRFFDVTELAGLRIGQADVFEAVHAVTFELYSSGMIDGVRVDHVDGLADPAAYCRLLRARLDALAAGRPAGATPGPAYIVVEKILGNGEDLPGDWGMDGTTGYDFMNHVSALQHDPAGEAPLTDLWVGLSGRAPDFETEELAAREEMLRTAFDRQLDAAAEAFHQIALGDPETRDLTSSALTRALIAIIRRLRVYRTYATGTPGSPGPGEFFEEAVAAAVADAPAEDWAIRFIARTLSSDSARDAAKRFNQLTAPVAAKAVEDTAFYRYGRLLSRTDVGFQPGRMAMEPRQFHEAMAGRAEDCARSMLATATHDHKRGEDHRARLAVLSELPHEWMKAVEIWRDINQARRSDMIAPDDEYQLYQTLVGAWPLDLVETDAGGLKDFRARISAWRTKSLREAKLRTSWAAPEPAFEDANIAFLEAILDPDASPGFLARLRGFVDRIAPVGAMNGLVQLVLRCTAPGMPDMYQGAEFWDFSMVDPDNRRPVEYDARIASFADAPPVADLAGSWRDGRIKQHLARRLLALRAREPELFANGDYRPLEAKGLRKDKVFAFARRHGGKELIVAVPIRCASALVGADRIAPPAPWWDDTELRLDSPGSAPVVDCLGAEDFGGGEELSLSRMHPAPALVVLRAIA
jgi:(1->4)-alpha-D-glucan 1-alpha-D-glucosylmutase